jgi:hypothetical protein
MRLLVIVLLFTLAAFHCSNRNNPVLADSTLMQKSELIGKWYADSSTNYYLVKSPDGTIKRNTIITYPYVSFPYIIDVADDTMNVYIYDSLLNDYYCEKQQYDLQNNVIVGKRFTFFDVYRNNRATVEKIDVNRFVITLRGIWIDNGDTVFNADVTVFKRYDGALPSMEQPFDLKLVKGNWKCVAVQIKMEKDSSALKYGDSISKSIYDSFPALAISNDSIVVFSYDRVSKSIKRDTFLKPFAGKYLFNNIGFYTTYSQFTSLEKAGDTLLLSNGFIQNAYDIKTKYSETYKLICVPSSLETSSGTINVTPEAITGTWYGNIVEQQKITYENNKITTTESMVGTTVYNKYIVSKDTIVLQVYDSVDTFVNESKLAYTLQNNGVTGDTMFSYSIHTQDYDSTLVTAVALKGITLIIQRISEVKRDGVRSRMIYREYCKNFRTFF